MGFSGPLVPLVNDPLKWLIALGVFLGAFLAFRVVRRLVLRKLERLSGATPNRLDDLAVILLRATGGGFLLAWSFFLATLPLSLKPPINQALSKGIILVTLLQAGRWGASGITFWAGRYVAAATAADAANSTTIGLVSFLAKFALFGMLVLVGLNNLGVDITALVAGLGVGGIAVALAVQNILGDLFASLTIVLDKPFVAGDFIMVGEHMGTIERIGLKTTRLRSLSGEQLVFSNADLLQSRIRNFKRMQERRVAFTLGVIYGTPGEMLRRIPAIVRQAIEARGSEMVRFERSHFKGYGASSLDFESVYWVKDPDYQVHMDLQQEINFEIFDRFAAEGIEFAYPTQTLFVRSEPGEAAPSLAADSRSFSIPTPHRE